MRTLLLITFCLAIFVPSLAMTKNKITLEQAIKAKIALRKELWGKKDPDPNINGFATGVDANGPYIMVGLKKEGSVVEPFYKYTDPDTNETFWVPVQVRVTGIAVAQ